MATAGIQFKIMPKSIEVNLGDLKEKIKETINNFESGVFNESREV